MGIDRLPLRRNLKAHQLSKANVGLGEASVDAVLDCVYSVHEFNSGMTIPEFHRRTVDLTDEHNFQYSSTKMTPIVNVTQR